jgi:hypothetical protein
VHTFRPWVFFECIFKNYCDEIQRENSEMQNDANEINFTSKQTLPSNDGFCVELRQQIYKTGPG